MPNTLAHVGMQGPLTRLAVRDADLRWIFAGVILPDLPWILQRVISPLLGLEGLVTLKAYGFVQASLLWCLLGAAALALLTASPGRVFAVLGLNALVHLLLDATEGLWAVHVHLFAPFDWSTLDWGLYWPGSAAELLLTLGGAAFAALEWPTAGRPLSRVQSQPIDLRSWPRLAGAIALFLAYFVTPFAALDGPYRADIQGVRTLSQREGRAGRVIELDNARYRHDPAGDTIEVFTGESIAVTGLHQDRSGYVSLRGRFADDHTLEILALHAHPPGARDTGSYVGLLLAAAAWMWPERWRGAPRLTRRPSSRAATGDRSARWSRSHR